MTIDSLSLHGKIAIVTGSGRENGIGAAIAMTLGRHGAAVTIHYVNDSVTDRAQAIADGIREDGGKAAVVQASIETPEGAQYLVGETLRAFNTDHIDILVLDVNIKGTIFIAQAVIPLIAPEGRIVNISSIASKLGDNYIPVYGASKAALDSLTWSWAKEWGRSKGITVNAVAPGPVLTDAIPAAIADEFQRPSIEMTRAANRAGTAKDIADAVLLLVSEKARWITGQYISVSGGVTN
ncbi:related to 3-oxoacyl-[acyl-carrier-protein] reductase [Fusarium fujikuroi]|nr:related to 3-oxoacyl-[acyl-carrier-protein] reductase [Fusarium fujikuroi]